MNKKNDEVCLHVDDHNTRRVCVWKLGW